MATSFAALCTDFYVNQKLAVKMDLPQDRETVLHMFDRMRQAQPSMTRFQRFADELALESDRREGAYRWLAVRDSSIESGHVNPAELERAYELHRLLLRISPFHLSISPLDVEYLELLFGFDLEARANQHRAVYEALLDESPLAELLDQPGAEPLDVQPIVGMSLNEACNLQASFEVKAMTDAAQIRSGQYRTEPISIFLSVRRHGPIEDPDDLLEHFETLRDHGERLASEKLIPHLLTPISRALTSSA